MITLQQEINTIDLKMHKVKSMPKFVLLTVAILPMCAVIAMLPFDAHYVRLTSVACIALVGTSMAAELLGAGALSLLRGGLDFFNKVTINSTKIKQAIDYYKIDSRQTLLANIAILKYKCLVDELVAKLEKEMPYRISDEQANLLRWFIIQYNFDNSRQRKFFLDANYNVIREIVYIKQAIIGATKESISQGRMSAKEIADIVFFLTQQSLIAHTKIMDSLSIHIPQKIQDEVSTRLDEQNRVVSEKALIEKQISQATVNNSGQEIKEHKRVLKI